MENVSLDVLNAGNMRNVRLNMEPRANGNVRTVKNMLLFIFARLVHIAHSMGPRRVILEPVDTNHGTVELDVWTQVESLDVRLQVIDVVWQGDVIGSSAWEAMVREAGQLYA